ncbi:hypothetical protein BDR04DRAFT_1019735 [Suillus decipiens]|nr:hypothetical protein BDR04DRAFT_1019735 [Suillus decipiens]
MPLALVHHFAPHTYSLTPDAQIWHRFLNTNIDGRECSIYLVVCDIDTRSGQGYDFYLSYVFMQHFYTYTVLDTTNSRVCFAPIAFTDATTNY